MREILFRGKRLDDGEWVYGSFCMDALEQFNGLCGVDGFIRLYDKEKGKMQTYEVDRETVGQYTGLKDKNGKRIFEGDIIRTKEYGKCIGRANVKGFDIFSVIYSPAVFRIERESPPRVFNFVGNGADYEIIGNIHDNPELLVEVSHNG